MPKTLLEIANADALQMQIEEKRKSLSRQVEAKRKEEEKDKRSRSREKQLLHPDSKARIPSTKKHRIETEPNTSEPIQELD